MTDVQLNFEWYIPILGVFNSEPKNEPRLIQNVTKKCVDQSYIFDLYVWRGFGIK